MKFTVKKGLFFNMSNEEKAILSQCTVYDGVNYYYTVHSVDGGLEPFMQNW